MKYTRMPIEIESPEQMGYDTIKCNLTESSVRDFHFSDLNININDLMICYGDHVGNPALRNLIAKEKEGIEKEDILLTIGAAGALFILQTAILSSSDHIIVMRPNYGTNIETPKAIGCEITFIDLCFDRGFKPNFDEIKAKIKPNTKLISITTPHNPTGVSLSIEELQFFIQLAEQHQIHLLVDETYSEIPIGKTPLPVAASLSKWAISICSLSKSYGLPGIRLGWLINKDKGLMEKLLAGKEQIYICNSIVDEEIAYQAMCKKDSILSLVRKNLEINFAILNKWMLEEKNLQFVMPDGGVVVFPKMNEDIDENKFYEVLNKKYATYVGPGHWFEMDRKFFRLGFGWPTAPELQEGLENISKALKEARI
jgi:aspartate/methionine/tyrosine aminotransferase